MTTLDLVCISVLTLFTLSAILALKVPFLNKFLDYGKLSHPKRNDTLVDKLSNITVKKSLFVHFYYTLVALEIGKLFLGYHWYMRDRLLVLQGIRRIIEQRFIFKPSNAEMHVSHYFVGIVFYTIQAVYTDKGRHMSFIPLFLAAMFLQSYYHFKLSTTVKYNVPFQTVACPHYGAEVAIYFLFWANSGYGFNVACASFIWVVVCLGISGTKTRDFYKVKYSIMKYVY